VTKTSCSTGEC